MTHSRLCDEWAPTADPERARLTQVLGGLVSETLAGVLDLVAPRTCGACELKIEGAPSRDGRRGRGRARMGDGPRRNVDTLCMDCTLRCHPPDGPSCPRCAGPRRRRRGCGRCARFGRPFAFARAVALWSYEGPVRDGIRAAKFAGRRELLFPWGRRLARAPTVGAWCRGLPGPLIVPVPCHRAALRRRGYDQARELAAGLSRESGVPIARAALVRRREPSRSQARATRQQRRQAQRAAFRALPAEVTGRSVLLVDDVLSTGATADACARALRISGARDVSVVALAT